MAGPAAEPARTEPAEMADMPDWLSEVHPVANQVSVDDIDWDDEAEEEEQEEAAVAADIPDWLSESAPAVKESTAQLEEEIGESFDWEEEIGQQDVVADTEGVLADIAAHKAAQPQYEPEDQGEELDWLSDIPVEGAEAVQDFGAEDFEQLSGYEEEEIAPAPASNAPDWLNAMVPGLDVDYDAPEDAPIEQAYADEGQSHRSARGGQEVAAADGEQLKWLYEMVDEETGTGPGASERQFVFSRPPLWMRRSASEPPVVRQGGPTRLDIEDIPADPADSDLGDGFDIDFDDSFDDFDPDFLDEDDGF